MEPIDAYVSGENSNRTLCDGIPTMTSRFSELIDEVLERYPIIGQMRFFERGDETPAAPAPPILGVMLNILRQADAGGFCLVLPSRDQLPFALAVTAALKGIEEGFEELELDRLTVPWVSGQMVKVAPEGWVFEFVEDGRVVKGRSWIVLRNPRDDNLRYLPQEEVFRLTPTDATSPSPPARMGPGRWKLAPIDQLLQIRTGGNLAIIPNSVILVSSRAATEEQAGETFISVGEGPAFQVQQVLTWGRIGRDGHLVSEDRRDGARDPIVAVTHSVDLMIAACRRPEIGRKNVIIDGASALSRNLQGYDEIAARHRVLVVSDPTEEDPPEILMSRGCEVWAPPPGLITGSPREGGEVSGWFSRPAARARNCANLALEGLLVTDPLVEDLHRSFKKIELLSKGGSEASEGIVARVLRLLLTVCEWCGSPGQAETDSFCANLSELGVALSRGRPWISAEISDELEKAQKLCIKALDEPEKVGVEKSDMLLSQLSGGPRTAIVTRAAHAAARLRFQVESIGASASVHQAWGLLPEEVDLIVLFSWLGRTRVRKLASQFMAPRIQVIGYPFELDWMDSFRGFWNRERQRYQRSTEDVRRFTGLATWPEDERDPSTMPLPEPHPPDDVDPITLILNRRRKGLSGRRGSEGENREAKYIGFLGPGYAFLTETHKVPVLTDFLFTGEPSRGRIPLWPLRKLRLGDFLLFRDHGTQDIISLLAESELGKDTYSGLRELAASWRAPLASIASNPHTVWARLQQAGLTRNPTTVKTWLTDEDRIGPRSEKDLALIAEVSGDTFLKENLRDVSSAIREVWAAHIKAGFSLSSLLLKELPGMLPDIGPEGGRFDFGFGGGWIVTIDEIGEEREERPYWDVNRLLFDEAV